MWLTWVNRIRTFFIKAHVTHSFQISDNKLVRWLRSQATKANDILAFRRHRTEDHGLTAIWDDRRGDIQQIRTWLLENADTFIVVQGPKGSGKRELVLDQALNNRPFKLVIDCKPIMEARGDSSTIAAAAQEVGYRPVFSWMNSISSLVDLAAQGTIGTKTGFSETVDTQLDNIWQNTKGALKSIALEGRRKGDKDANLGEDEYLEAHPERRPVVVIDHFLHKGQENTLVYDKLAKWAAGLTTANIAHVIFLTTDVSFGKSLGKALPDRVFHQISLGDCSPEVANRYVVNYLDADFKDDFGNEGKVLPSQTREDLSELNQCIEILGGRLTDLEFLARRIKTGETPNSKQGLEYSTWVCYLRIVSNSRSSGAIHEIIEQSASEILKMYILDANRGNRAWTPEQVWLIIKSLAKDPCIRYNELLLSDTFKSSNGEATLQALEQAELINIISTNGRPRSIKPGRPVFSAAFKRLTNDHVLKARMDLAIFSELIKIETQGIEKCENELGLLAKLPHHPAETHGRIKWLLNKMKEGQEKVEGYERESGLLKGILKREF